MNLMELFLLLGKYLEEYFPEHFGNQAKKVANIELKQNQKGVTVYICYPFHKQALFSIPVYLQD